MRVHGDFNGLFREILCLSHADWTSNEAGERVPLRAGMFVTAFEPDVAEDGQPDELLASGVVEPAPDWLSCRGSKWVLRIDARGVRHRSEQSPAETFDDFLRELADGGGTGPAWERVVTTHYSDPTLEQLRAELVEASIGAGQWSWPAVPMSVRAAAARLHARLDLSGRAGRRA